MDLPDFSKLLKEFDVDVEFVKLLTTHTIDCDTLAYEILTSAGAMVVFEIDYIYGLSEILEEVRKVGDYKKFINVKQQLNFDIAAPVKAALTYQKPHDWDEIKKYANDKFGSSNNYFNFLLK